ncbi:hypothetical protein [Cedecea sp. NFIX57]|uniref:hypothetical protein n=1 Tax=Cedecea sp. NFIX57 TaxID=1566286 RepID=UPI000A0A5A3F|nr:hypothetical protein [Cedecea sp. NFIX57]SMG29099.1 hypothetical protein SAMN03159353_1006105 [Cedecea sp. NFIX57]
MPGLFVEPQIQYVWQFLRLRNTDNNTSTIRRPGYNQALLKIKPEMKNVCNKLFAMGTILENYTGIKKLTMLRKLNLSAGAACVMLGLLTGCTEGVPKYKEPPVATVAVKNNQARIVFRSAGMPMTVNYAVNSSTPTSEGFTPIGRVFHSGREVLLPWIATMTENARKTISDEQLQIEKTVDAEHRIRIRGMSAWSDYDQHIHTSGSCGPLFSQFIPEGGSTYLVEFRFKGTDSCSQQVYKIGAGEERLPVSS